MKLKTQREKKEKETDRGGGRVGEGEWLKCTAIEIY